MKFPQNKYYHQDVEQKAPQKVLQYPKNVCFLKIFCCNSADYPYFK